MLSVWHFSREDFARRVLTQLQIAESLSLFAPRRTGKTRFVVKDLCWLAYQDGFQPLYVDLWEVPHDSAQALINAFRRAAYELETPASATKRTLTQEVLSFRILGVGAELAPIERPEEPDEPLSCMRFWFDRVIAKSEGPILLIVDEAQQMALDTNGAGVAAALRSALTSHANHVRSFFTGSSQHNLSLLLDHASAPFYQFAQRVVLPQLDRAFVDYVADEFEAVATLLKLDRDALYASFIRLGHAPGPFIEMVSAMLMANTPDIGPFEDRALFAVRERVESMIKKHSLGIRELAVAARISHGLSYTSREALARYKALEGGKRNVAASQVHRAVEKLVALSLIDRGRGHGEAYIASWEFANYVKARFPVETISGTK